MSAMTSCNVYHGAGVACACDGQSWSTAAPVLTHCPHGLDLRIYPRCYLCDPEFPLSNRDGCQCPVIWHGTMPPPCPVHNPPRYYEPTTTTWVDHT